MSTKDVSSYRKIVKMIGVWTGARFLRNKGVPFEEAYEIIFGRKPRVI